MNKKVGLLFAVLFISTLLVGLASVSAASPSVPEDSNWIDITIIYIQYYSGPVWEASAKIVSPLVGATTEVESDGKIFTANEIILARFLLLFLLASVIWGVSSVMPFFTAPWQRGVLTFIVSILGVRYLNNEFIYAIIMPYGAFAVAVSVLIPFILYTAFVENAFTNSVARKAAWIVFGVAILFLGIYRWDSMGEVKWFYPVVSLVCLGMIYFDRRINGWFVGMLSESLTAATRAAIVADINDQITWAQTESAKAPGTLLHVGGFPGGLAKIPSKITSTLDRTGMITPKTIKALEGFIKERGKALPRFA